MKVSVEKLRWWLAAALVLLLAGLLGLVGYGRWAAARKWKELLARNGIHISRDSDNVTWSQTVQGRTLFTIRAKKVIPISDGKYTLHGVTMLLYSKTSNGVDRVTGDEFEYDEKEGVAKAIGEVHMDIQAPGALKRQSPDAAKGGPKLPAPAVPQPVPQTPDFEHGKDVIHVLTSGLVYVKKLGVAATDQRVEFRYAGITCVSRGAEFGTNENTLRLLADVVMNGDLHGRPATLRASRADLDRDENTIDIQQPVGSTTTPSGTESVRAAHALLHLRPDGSVQQGDATGNVVLENAGRRVQAAHLVADFGPQNAPQTAVLSGGVTLDGTDAKPMHGTAAEADLTFAPTGALKTLVARGGVGLAGSMLHPGQPALAREMHGDLLTAMFQPVGKGTESVLQEMHVTGRASARSESFATAKAVPGNAVPEKAAKPGPASSGIVSTQVNADDLLATFTTATVPGGKGKEALLQHLIGQGHTQLEQKGLDEADEQSTADRLEVAMTTDKRPGAAAGALQLQSAVQTGHVHIHNQAATQPGRKGALSLAHGEQATFDGSSDRLTLAGGAAYQQEGISLMANTIMVEQGSGNAEAQGEVEAAVASAGHDATHVLADRAKLMRAAQTAEFFGTDGHPARMWQAGSQITAANLYLDDARQTLLARPAAQGGTVEAVFSAAQGKNGSSNGLSGISKDAPTGGRKQVGGGAGEAVHVTTPSLNYSGERHEAVCSGGVKMRQGGTQARSQQAVVFLAAAPASPAAKPQRPTELGSPAEFGGTLERMVLSGAVRLDAPGGAGEGEQLVYTAKDGNYLLTGTPGKPPRVANAEQGLVTGPALLFRSGEKSVIVDSAGTSNGSGGHPTGGRVHTDVVVKQQER